MSKKKTETTPQPTAPKPQNEYYYDNGALQSSRVYDKTKGGYVSNSYSTPDEQAIQNNSTAFIKSLSDRIPNEFSMTPDQLDAGVAAYTDPQTRALNQSYNDAIGASRNSAGASGMRNSVGFSNYLGNVIEKNKAQGLADIAAGGEQMRYQLPSMRLAPFMDAFNLINAANTGEQAKTQANLNPSFQGSQAASNYFASLYPNQLQAWQAMNQQNQNRGGLFSLFG